MKSKRIPMNLGLVAVTAIAVLALALAGCAAGSTPTATTPGHTTGSTSTSTPPATTTTTTTPPPSTTVTTTPVTPQSVTVDLVAKNIQFDKKTITVPAGAQVTVNFDNQDAGIPHNFALYTDSGAQTSLFVGEIVAGPKKVTYTFTAPATPGNYYFRCDVHPGQMNGTFVVQ
jgi:plastocyanin